MAKKKTETNTELANTSSPGMSVPDYLQDDAGMGLENTAGYIVPPRMRIVQAQSRAPLSELFNIGDTVAVPQNVMVAPHLYEGPKALESGEIFHITPLFFYVEFLLWNDIKLQGTEKSVLERTTNPDDELALKARNPNTWQEAHPNGKDGYFVRYSEHLNFIVNLEVPGHELAGMPMVMSFSGAEHRSGANFLALLKMRRAPIFGCGFQVSTSRRENSKGNWFGWDIVNPADHTHRWTSPDLIGGYKQIYTEMKEAYESDALRAEYEDEAAGDSAPKDSGEF